MVTTRIQIKSHLKEYIVGKYNDMEDVPVSFPDNIDLYHYIWDWARKRPADCQVDIGNLEIVLPNRRAGKKPEVYNYIPYDGVKDIERKIENLMFAELHTLVDEQKHREGIEIKTSVFYFMAKYGIDSITSDALVKNFQRWRYNIRRSKCYRNFKIKM